MALSYDDFTLYIFGEDLAKLRSFSHGAEGSLYGLWTSTLNPVIHVVYERRSSSQSLESIRSGLAERYKMSYLGDWRVVGRSGAESMISPPSHFQPGGANGFLAVNVVNGEVIPYMYERPTDRNPKRGSVDALRGDNPFTNDQDTRAIINGGSTRRWQERAVPTGSEAYENYHRQQERQRYGETYPPNQRRVVAGEPVHTNSTQWYSSDGGEQELKRVFDRIKKIAEREDVKMSRDLQSQDITLSFRCRRKDWTIQFPASFPRVGAMIREVNSRRFGSPVEKRTSSASIYTAIEEICRTVQT